MKNFIVLSLVICKFAYASELKLVLKKPEFPKPEEYLHFLSEHASWILMELDQRLQSDLKPVPKSLRSYDDGMDQQVPVVHARPVHLPVVHKKRVIHKKPALLKVTRSLAAMAEESSEKQKRIEFNALRAKYLNLSGLTEQQLRKKLMDTTENAPYRKRRAEKMKFLRLWIRSLKRQRNPWNPV